MAKWIQKMTQAKGFKEGALTKKADAAGQSPMAFARSHKNAGGLTGKQANAAINMQKRRHAEGGSVGSYCAGGKVLSSKTF
jgi:hypothetical protein